MMFETKKIGPKEASFLNSWWSHYGYGAIPVDAYPEISFLITHFQEPICAGSAYKTDSKVVFMDNVVSSPEKIDPQTKDMALDFLLSALTKEAKRQGFKYWSAHTKIKAIVTRAKKFNTTQYGENHYWITGDL